jgi:hypothetical protein
VDGFRIVKVYDNSTTTYHEVYDSDLVGEEKMVDLYSFLIREIDPDDVCVANVRGAASIPEESEDDDGPFGVLITRYFFNGEQTAWAELEDGRYDRLSFDSYFEALEWIAEQEKEIYHLSQNEHSRPDYKIVKVREKFVPGKTGRTKVHPDPEPFGVRVLRLRGRVRSGRL